ncbi:MAG: hypothetical protein ISS45_12075, partial [Candidatus Omnitrophica bacterium]|nr:hypothetical protein [Candidatus Omnitrophota bacterium]
LEYDWFLEAKLMITIHNKSVQFIRSGFVIIPEFLAKILEIIVGALKGIVRPNKNEGTLIEFRPICLAHLRVEQKKETATIFYEHELIARITFDIEEEVVTGKELNIMTIQFIEVTEKLEKRALIPEIMKHLWQTTFFDADKLKIACDWGLPEIRKLFNELQNQGVISKIFESIALRPIPEYLISGLKNKEFFIRAYAAEKLKKYPQAAALLKEHFSKESDSRVNKPIVRSIAYIEREKSLTWLKSIVDKSIREAGNFIAASAAVRAIGTLKAAKAQAYSALLEIYLGLESTDNLRPTIRKSMIKETILAMGRIKSKDAERFLITLLSGDDELKSPAAAEGLGNSSSEESVSALAEALNSEVFWIKYNAQKSLEKRGVKVESDDEQSQGKSKAKGSALNALLFLVVIPAVGFIAFILTKSIIISFSASGGSIILGLILFSDLPDILKRAYLRRQKRIITEKEKAARARRKAELAALGKQKAQTRLQKVEQAKRILKELASGIDPLTFEDSRSFELAFRNEIKEHIPEDWLKYSEVKAAIRSHIKNGVDEINAYRAQELREQRLQQQKGQLTSLAERLPTVLARQISSKKTTVDRLEERLKVAMKRQELLGEFKQAAATLLESAQFDSVESLREAIDGLLPTDIRNWNRASEEALNIVSGHLDEQIKKSIEDMQQFNSEGFNDPSVFAKELRAKIISLVSYHTKVKKAFNACEAKGVGEINKLKARKLTIFKSEQQKIERRFKNQPEERQKALGQLCEAFKDVPEASQLAAKLKAEIDAAQVDKGQVQKAIDELEEYLEAATNSADCDYLLEQLTEQEKKLPKGRISEDLLVQIEQLRVVITKKKPMIDVVAKMKESLKLIPRISSCFEPVLVLLKTGEEDKNKILESWHIALAEARKIDSDGKNDEEQTVPALSKKELEEIKSIMRALRTLGVFNIAKPMEKPKQKKHRKGKGRNRRGFVDFSLFLPKVIRSGLKVATLPHLDSILITYGLPKKLRKALHREIDKNHNKNDEYHIERPNLLQKGLLDASKKSLRVILLEINSTLEHILRTERKPHSYQIKLATIILNAIEKLVEEKEGVSLPRKLNTTLKDIRQHKQNKSLWTLEEIAFAINGVRLAKELPVEVEVKSVTRKGVVIDEKVTKGKNGKEEREYRLNTGGVALNGDIFYFVRRALPKETVVGVRHSKIGLFVRDKNNGKIVPLDEEMLIPEAYGPDVLALEDTRVIERDGVIYTYFTLVKRKSDLASLILRLLGKIRCLILRKEYNEGVIFYSVSITHDSQEFLEKVDQKLKNPERSIQWNWTQPKKLITQLPFSEYNYKNFVPFGNPTIIDNKEYWHALYRPDDCSNTTMRLAVSEEGLGGPWRDDGLYMATRKDLGWLGASTYISSTNGTPYDLMLYHRGASDDSVGFKYYDLRLIVSDKNNPRVKCTSDPILVPDYNSPYELYGWISGAIYSCFTILKNYDASNNEYTFDMYYSGSDSVVLLATVTLIIKPKVTSINPDPARCDPPLADKAAEDELKNIVLKHRDEIINLVDTNKFDTLKQKAIQLLKNNPNHSNLAEILENSIVKNGPPAGSSLAQEIKEFQAKHNTTVRALNLQPNIILILTDTPIIEDFLHEVYALVYPKSTDKENETFAVEVANGVISQPNTIYEIRSDITSEQRRDDFRDAMQKDKIYSVLRKYLSQNPDVYLMCLDNAFDAIMDRMIDNSFEDFTGKIVSKLYVDNRDVVIDITDNGKTVELENDSTPKRKPRNRDIQFGGLGQDELQGVRIIKNFTKTRNGMVKWQPLKEGTRVEIRVPRTNLPSEFHIPAGKVLLRNKRMPGGFLNFDIGKKKAKKPNINRISLSTLKSHLKSIEQLKDLDGPTIDNLAEWIIEHGPYRSREALKKTLQGTGISGVKKPHQEAIADSVKVGITRRQFFAWPLLAADGVALYFATKMLTNSVSQRDWTEVRNKIKTEKHDLNQELTRQFLAVYPDERDFIEQINSNQDVVFANYVAEVYKRMMNTPEKYWRSQLVVDGLRSAPHLIIVGVDTSFAPETLRHVEEIAHNKRMVGLVEKIMQCSNIKQLDKGLNDFDKMATDCIALRSATQALDSIHLGRKRGELARRLAYYWKPESRVSASEYAYVDLATGTNFEDYLEDILEYSPKRPILLTDISPYVIRFWHTLSRVLSLDNIQILDLDIRTMSRKTVPQKVGTIRLQNLAPWVKDLSEEWVEQIFDLVEPGGQVILVRPQSLREKVSSPQPMGLTELIDVVMLQDEDNAKLMLNLLNVAEKQEGKWNIFAGHVGK